ncbi:unnamed protein product [Diplocarpon coronariae]|nr:hypothetical protein JHW43_002278 [Diplocarpon mali]
MDLIGRVVSLPFIGPSADTYGRRFGMWVGYLMINVGTVVQGTAGPDHGAGQLMGDRSLLGLGVNITRATGPMSGLPRDSDRDLQLFPVGSLNQSSQAVRSEEAPVSLKRWIETQNMVPIAVCGWHLRRRLLHLRVPTLATPSVSSETFQANIFFINNCQQLSMALVGANRIDCVGRCPSPSLPQRRLLSRWLAMTVYAALFQASFPAPTVATPGVSGTNSLAGTTNAGSIHLTAFDGHIRIVHLHHLYDLVRCLNSSRLFFIPETKNRTLEEPDDIFELIDPVKISIARKRLGFDAYGDVVNIKDI